MTLDTLTINTFKFHVISIEYRLKLCYEMYLCVENPLSINNMTQQKLQYPNDDDCDHVREMIIACVYRLRQVICP